MTAKATRARWTRREREAAEALGSKRVHRSRFEKAPDVERIQAPCGRWVQAESKTRARLPAWITRWLKQAEGYGLPGDAPLVVASEKGGRAIAITWLRDFAELSGLRPSTPEAQPTLPIAGANDG